MTYFVKTKKLNPMENVGFKHNYDSSIVIMEDEATNVSLDSKKRRISLKKIK